jgi:O-antigen ligase
VTVIYRILIALTMIAIAWGALAFGAVYRWAYMPLAALCAFVGLVSIAGLRWRTPLTSVALGLIVIGAAITLQLVPLSPWSLEKVSPATDAFLSRQEFSYSMSKSRRDADDPSMIGVRPKGRAISLAPSRTVVGLVLFSAFALFLIGTAKLLSLTGVAPAARSLVLIGVATALMAIVQYALLGNSEREPIKIYGFWTPRYRAMSFGPFINRNHFAGWMLMTLPIAIGSALAAMAAVPGQVQRGWRGTLAWLSTPDGAGAQLMLFAAGVMGTAVILSESRSGLAALAVGAAVFASLVVRREQSRARRVATVTAFTVTALLVVGWAGAEVLVRRVSSLEQDLSSIGGRRQAWADTIDIIRDFPLTGTGLNTYGTAMIQYQTAHGTLHFQEAHNDYLQLAAEGGLLVGLPVLVTLGLFVHEVRRRFNEAPRAGNTYWVRVGAVTGLVAIAVQSLFEFSLQMPGNAVLFAFLAAIALHRSPSVRKGVRRASDPTDR